MVMVHTIKEMLVQTKEMTVTAGAVMTDIACCIKRNRLVALLEALFA